MKLAYRYGGSSGKEYALEASADMVVVRTGRRAPLRSTPASARTTEIAHRMQPVVAFPMAGVEVFRTGDVEQADALKTLKAESQLQWAGTCLHDSTSRQPVLYTENIFVKFRDDADAKHCRKVVEGLKLEARQALTYSRNAFFVSAPEGTGRRTFEIAAELLDEETVDFCHPELIRETGYRGAFPQQWHLQGTQIGSKFVDASANVVPAWGESHGEGIVIAIIDDGVDMEHEEFATPGKIVGPRDVTRRTNDPRPGSTDHHGTACAGVACGDGLHGASGVAPKAKLMPIRLRSGLGSQAEADAFVWAAQQGADVISCSWGPVDGRWWDDDDPRHDQVTPLPDSTRLAIDFAIENGRGGKGCVITWAAGNGNESVDNDGYASYEKVISVAACNDRSERSRYSDFGKANWCAFPSSDGVPTDTPGIWTTDRTGSTGYNPGSTSQGDAAGKYTNDFGGTSSACPGAAGVAALVLAKNPALRWDEVKELFKESCDRIDESNGNYDAGGHSESYGYGRLNAATAVGAAVPPAANYRVTHKMEKEVPVQDFQTASIELEVPEDGAPTEVRVHVGIEHTYIGDLTVQLFPPEKGDGIESIVLHNRTGGGTNDLTRSYDALTTPELAALKNRDPQGTWKLVVEDSAGQDTGKIKSFSVELAF